MAKVLKIAGIVLGVIVVLALILFGAWTWFSRQAIPKTSGTVEVAGLIQPVEIVRDEYSVPHIYGQTPEDLFFAEGYVHAQERFWQMEFQRRLGSGRLSEIFGESSLETDRFLRHFDFRGSSEEIYASMGEEARIILDAYSAGVNAYIMDRSPSSLGLEFALLGLQGVKWEIEEWTPVDSLVWAYMMVFDQASRFNELEYLKVIATVGRDMAGDLLPPYRDDRPTIIQTEDLVSSQGIPSSTFVELGEAEKSYLSALALGSEPELFGLASGFASASNSMAISGELTDSGNAYLANDPHMGVQAPSLWYEVGAHCVPKSAACIYNFRGFSLPGVPGILIGHNDRIAWGLTNGAFDAEDLFIERINPDNPDQYEVNGDWVDMDIKRHEIVVRGWDEPDILNVRSTRNGVVATDELIDQDPYSSGTELHVLSYAWTALDPIRSVEGVFGVNGAQDWDDFNDALALFDAGKQNWIYADVEGNIGFILPGKIPIRASGDGTLPVPGWNDDYIWNGFVPYSQAPKVLNPEQGFIATANNLQVRDDAYLYDLGYFQDRGQRAERITQLIEGHGGLLSIEDLQHIHTDNASVGAQEIMPYLENIEFDDPDVSSARDQLVDWDSQMLMDSPEAALFAFFWTHLLNETYNDQLPDDLHVSGSNIDVDSMYHLLHEEDNPWWDDPRTSTVVELRDEILERSFVLAYEDGVEQIGEDLAEWRWGDLHQITYRNATLGNSGIGLIEDLFNRGPFPTSGSNADVIQKTCWAAGRSFDVGCIPALRQVIDLGDLSRSTMVHNLGQSGHPMDEHYDDFIDPWRFFEYHPSNWDRVDAEAGNSDLLILEPKS
ncbi:MAG TPA: penicillin acylase family protein [candidate division Zixibacteria bacterium]|nr:penicillin acylase family protein [candidate division Zixibacteria bacterium]